MSDSLEIKVCERCGKKTAEEVIEYLPDLNAKRKGWYCVSCYHWDRAVGRESKIESSR